MTSSRAVVAEPVPSALAVMVSSGIVAGAGLPARSSVQVPPAWKWFMCLIPSFGSPCMLRSTLTPSPSWVMVAVPLTPESRLGVS